MAAVTAPSPGLVHTVLGVLATVATDVGQPIDDAWERLLHHLEGEEVRSLPAAVASVTPHLEADSARRRLALDLLVTLDLYEATTTLIDLAPRGTDYGLAAAALAAHPGNPPELAEQARSLGETIGLSSAEREAFAIRLSPQAPAATPYAKQLMADRWPGSSNGDGVHRQTVVVHPTAGDEQSAAALLSQLHRLGVRIRRTPAAWRSAPSSAWIDSAALVVAGSGAAIAELREHGLPVTPDRALITKQQLAPGERRRIADLVAQRAGLVREPLGVDAQPSDEVLAPGVFRSGAFDNHEMAFLGGVRHGVPHSVRTVLEPRKIGALNYWDFSQLVALRCWHYFKEVSGKRRFPVDLVANLTSIAQSQEETIVGVTATGNVLYEAEGNFVDARSGQLVPPELVVRVDEVFQPIKIGAGHVPPLLAPSAYTRVHPETLAGTPTIRGKRIPVRAVARAASEDFRMAVRAYGDELTEDEIRDAISVGRQLLAA